MSLVACFSASLVAQDTQKFEIDPFWPKPLPDKWIIGRTGSICADAHDHLVVTNRRDITAEEAETSIQAPSVLIFDLAGNLVQSFGDSNTVPGVIHGCFVDHENNIWLTGNGDGIVQKWTHDGKLLLQIGKRGVFDTTDGTAKGQLLNSGRTQFFNPAGVVVDPANGDVYVADGYGNRRVAVFDRSGNFLRQWGKQATQQEIEAGTGGAFAQIVHCIAMSRAGLIYVCDRQGQRVQVFDKSGTFVQEHLGQDRHPDAARSARHGLVDCVLARSRTEIHVRHERPQRTAARPRPCKRKNSVELRTSRTLARKFHAWARRCRRFARQSLHRRDRYRPPHAEIRAGEIDNAEAPR